MPSTTARRRPVALSLHRGIGIADLIIAITAREHGLTVLHYDHEFDLIAAAAGTRSEWVVAPEARTGCGMFYNEAHE